MRQPNVEDKCIIASLICHGEMELCRFHTYTSLYACALIRYYQVVTGHHKSTIMFYCFPHFVIPSYCCSTGPDCCCFLSASFFPSASFSFNFSLLVSSLLQSISSLQVKLIDCIHHSGNLYCVAGIWLDRNDTVP